MRRHKGGRTNAERRNEEGLSGGGVFLRCAANDDQEFSSELGEEIAGQYHMSSGHPSPNRQPSSGYSSAALLKGEAQVSQRYGGYRQLPQVPTSILGPSQTVPIPKPMYDLSPKVGDLPRVLSP